MAEKCGFCGSAAGQKCAGCHNVFYCSREHQKKAWKLHKLTCKPIKLDEDPVLGRYLVASRRIKPNEVIYKEKPLVWGPTQETIPVCLGCNKAISEEDSKPCIKCGWPVCSEVCQKSPSHIPECNYTVHRGEKVNVKNFGIVHPIYQCITVLRCLYLKQFLPEVWEKLDKLQSHCEERKKTSKYEQERITIAQFILRFFKLGSVFTEEDIMRVCGIVMVNAHEVPLTNPQHVAIYECTSMFEHNCRANCSKSFTKDGWIVLSAADQCIDKGEHLSICYTDPLWGTPNRLHHLSITKFFSCTCLRCADPTELGTNFSSIKCDFNGCTGYMLPKSFLDPDNQTDWICGKCGKAMTDFHVHDILERVGSDLANLQRGDSSACKIFLERYKDILHSNHYYFVDVKLALNEIIGQEGRGLMDVTEDDLELKVKICKQLGRLLKDLVPAEKRVRGMVLFELHAALNELNRRRVLVAEESERLPMNLSCLEESKELLMDVIELLKNEPEVLPEGKIYEQARENLKKIEDIMRSIHCSIGDSPF